MIKKMNNKENILVRLLVTFVIAFIGGVSFSFLGVPIPWLLGPMVAAAIASKLINIDFYWPEGIRNTGLIIVGYSIGLSFTKDSLIQIIHQLPSMLLMTVTIIIFCAVFALLVAKLSGIDYPTILTGSIPGGLSQMITLAEEINVTVVTFLQVARLMMIIIFIPFLVYSPFLKARALGSPEVLQTVPGQWSSFFPGIIVFACVSVLCAILGKKINLPTAYLLGPIIGIAVLNIWGYHGPELPSFLLNLSQFMIGGYFGLLMKPEKLKHKVKIISLAIISDIVMIIITWGLGLALTVMHGISTTTSFLSVAPGGMDQMGIIAHEVHADLSIVTGYQLFRIFFIFFIVPPMLKRFFKLHMRKKGTAN